ncbi:checkpoint protein HUS1-like isoform X2 [Xenia sp. Carnegie-2017]|uniref:checkpoint protein HUS1-like isoform X2 n=1 Tax=Xenia sp. Carnegie-2017 TaxID=2897299 RepID=UPI001F03906E|nr:checkpoint protein HUS1-like isoform X2 [Xenia sp. Carnegie-2017]
MRFKAKLVDISSIHKFTSVVSTVSHMAKMCALRLSPSTLYFIMNDTAAEGGATVWCEVNQSSLFEEFRIEGIEGSNDNIYLELCPENLVKAMRSAANAQMVKIKLTNKVTPCLTFEISLPSMVRSRKLIHDTPVTVIRQAEWDDYQEPQLQQYDISICMPSLKTVKNIVDKMKQFNSQIVISANSRGCMTLKVATDLVTTTTYFKGLEVEDLGNHSNASNCSNTPRTTEATLDIKKFLAFFHGQNINPTKVICNISDQRTVHFHLTQDDFSLEYLIPAIVTGEI